MFAQQGATSLVAYDFRTTAAPTWEKRLIVSRGEPRLVMRCDLHYLAIVRRNLLSSAFALRLDIEVKQDGFRLIVLRDGDRVRLFTGNGFS